MSKLHAPAPKPCASCPYRRDVPSGIWSEHEYTKLPDYDAETPYQPVHLFQCHQNDRKDDRARLCAGWVGCHGSGLLSLRIAAANHTLTDAELAATFNYATTVPLFESGAEAAEHGMRDIDNPSPQACELVEKIANRRDDIRMG